MSTSCTARARFKRPNVAALAVLGMLAFESFGRQSAPADAAAWRQWGGPTRNFIVTSSSLADASETGVTILAQAKIFDTTSWTVPTLAGTTLYARDREKIVALDLSARAVSEAR